MCLYFENVIDKQIITIKKVYFTCYELVAYEVKANDEHDYR